MDKIILWGSLKNTDLITSFWAGTFSNYGSVCLEFFWGVTSENIL